MKHTPDPSALPGAPPGDISSAQIEAALAAGAYDVTVPSRDDLERYLVRALDALRRAEDENRRLRAIIVGQAGRGIEGTSVVSVDGFGGGVLVTPRPHRDGFETRVLPASITDRS